jgi:diacylglycerol kinase (ATP)
MGVGFDAEVVRHANRIRRLRGMAVYVAAVYRTFVTFRAPVLEVASREHTEQGPMMMLAAAIGVCAGGGFYLTPTADPADGLLDVCAVRKVGLSRFLRAVPRVMKGTHVTLDEVSMFRTASLSVRCAERPLVLQLDGELRETGAHEVTVTIQPRRLRVLVGR